MQRLARIYRDTSKISNHLFQVAVNGVHFRKSK